MKFLFRALFFLIPFLYSIYVSSQPKKERDCSTTCFSSEVVSVEKLSATCTAYELKVTYAGQCAHALSHFTVAVPCGTIDQLWNSENWAQEIGTDPTSGLSGFKIDNISGFGEGSLQQFIVKFNLCASGDVCSAQLDCWQPQVAYKAATCVNYETLAVNCRSLKASLKKNDASCFEANDGSLTLVIEEGQAPYSILWSDNSNGESLTGLTAGTYSVIVRDQTGAEVTLEENIKVPEKMSVSGTTSPASCNGIADGSIDLTAVGGTGLYSFSWNNGAKTEDLQDVSSGMYTVTVTDDNNCSASAAFTIGNASKINIAGSPVKPDCNDTNGSIDITVTGGTTPYSFSWSDNSTSANLENIGAGVYTVTVTDQNGCVEKASYLIQENNTLVLKGTTTPSSCTEDSGTISLTVSGGADPYIYTWSNGAETKDLSGLSSGYYAVTVKDQKGCTVNGGYAVSKSTFQVSRVVLQPTCRDENDGSITLLEPIGGTGPYTYAWSTNGETGTSLHDLGPGVYSVTITDATGCSRMLTSTINNPAKINASATISNEVCNAEGSYSVDLAVSGGSSPYTYAWSDGSTGESLAGVEKGTYSVVITDALGCSITKEIQVEGENETWACIIDEPSQAPICGSTNNTLSTSVAEADSYSWTVQSTDGNWSIADSSSPSIVFTAGGENSTATFTLTIEEDGCNSSCTYSLSSCIPEDNGGGTDPGDEEPGNEEPGGEEPGGEEPGGDGENGEGEDQTCETCFSTAAKLVEVSGSCRTYEMEVSTNGLCRHDLSHFTVAIPCGSTSNYSNSEGWKMEFGKDPTTGLYGLKVDDISTFGKTPDSFTIRFTVCETSGCELSSWNPVVAYKAALCVGMETIQILSASVSGVSVYPNPFNETVSFEWNATHEKVDLQIIDQYGNTLSSIANPTGKHDKYYITLESGGLPKGMYYYRLTVDGKTWHGKISKR